MPDGHEPTGRSYLTAPEAAQLAGISVRTLYRHLKSGRITSTRVLGGPHRFTREDVASWFDTPKDAA